MARVWNPDHPDHPHLPATEEPVAFTRAEVDLLWRACEVWREANEPKGTDADEETMRSLEDKLEWMDAHFKERGL